MNGSKIRSGGRRTVRCFLIALVGAGPTAGASSATAPDHTCEEVRRSADVPDRLSALAEKIASRSGGWTHAGELMLQVAKLRPECAPEKMEAMRAAARYFSFSGDYERASDVSFEAGEGGVWTGHVTLAAEAFIDAASYSLEAGDHARARVAAGHASRLSRSPLLSRIQRMTIRGRADRLLELCGGGFADRLRPGRHPVPVGFAP